MSERQAEKNSLIRTLTHRLEDRAQKIEELEEQVQRLVGQRDAETQRVLDREAEIEELHAQIASERLAATQRREDSLAGARLQLKEREHEVKVLSAVRDNLADRVEELEQAYEAQVAEIEVLTTERDNALLRVEELETMYWEEVHGSLKKDRSES